MANLSWNEIRDNALKFSRDHSGSARENADKQTFWNEFFGVFGLRRGAVAAFEEPVEKLKGRYGFIDLLWKGKALVEHKSRGESLDKAKSQAFDYIQELINSGRKNEVPRYVIVSDFANIVLYDLDPEEANLPLFRSLRVSKVADFPLAEFSRNVRSFAFIAGYQTYKPRDQDPINMEATQIMADLHDVLAKGGYSGHELERFLVRILFCLFADDTGIFPPETFHLYIRNRTAADGSDLGIRLAQLFEVLDTAPEQRSPMLDEELASFQYINGELFRERLRFANFNRPMREALLRCCEFDWAPISAAIFGSLFQEVIKDAGERRQIGAHYTSERDILKVVRSLFLDDLRAEFKTITRDRSTRRRARLQELHERIQDLKFLDPACGCGNFLVITYRELRQLELEILLEVHKTPDGRQTELSLGEVSRLSKVNVNQFYGIEIKEWPARVAEVALWLTDHQSNLKITDAFLRTYQRLPLSASPHILVANALRMDWNDLLPVSECSYVLGNPPFVGKHLQSVQQQADMKMVWADVQGAGLLDYVTAWYMKAAHYIQRTSIQVAFVSTNSITQGEQCGILWQNCFLAFS